ncbi:hypothetical protein PsorP6_006094 [Peronosclerospora sorghi]|uniref:Uncharacterized protein n=1 Tax=Peronosclerospora sorghi TaxID=230839 RepID=A0ACC0W3C4_9STRA|nr:hypothetical protein PsorP6_006094 [Peronosclerospora sorghi]
MTATHDILDHVVAENVVLTFVIITKTSRKTKKSFRDKSHPKRFYDKAELVEFASLYRSETGSCTPCTKFPSDLTEHKIPKYHNRTSFLGTKCSVQISNLQYSAL